MNEGLEKFGTKETIERDTFEGEVLANTAIETIRLPSTLKRIDARMFYLCGRLRSAEISNGVEHIGKSCFSNSGIEEVTFPSTLKEIERSVFDCCKCLKVVWMDDSCPLDIRKYVGDNVTILSTGVMVGDKLLRDLRKQKDLAIPDGTREIGERWFQYSEIESVIIPKSM